MPLLRIALISLGALAMHAQDATLTDATSVAKPQPKLYQVEAGTKIPLAVLKSVSTKTAMPGDPIYLETVFPVIASGRIVIPRGSFVTGSVTSATRAGKVKGRAELRVRLETLILPSGETLEFRGSISGIDPAGGEEVDEEGAIQGKGNKTDDLKNVMTGVGYGAMIGASVGAVSASGTKTTTGADPGNRPIQSTTSSVVRRSAGGSMVGMAAGAAAMYTATLFMRGPDAVLTKGADLDMVLDRPVTFEEIEVTASQQAPTALKGR